MLGKRTVSLSLSVLLLALLWFPYAAFQQLQSRNASVANCEDNGIGAWKLILRIHAGDHSDRLPTAAERASLATQYRASSTHFALTCNMGQPYVWNDGPRRVTSAEKAEPLAWCGKPHGFTEHWRNVLYTDLSLRKLPEADFQHWHSRQP